MRTTTAWHHLAAVQEWNAAVTQAHTFKDYQKARDAIYMARKIRRRACGSPLPGSQRMLYGS